MDNILFCPLGFTPKCLGTELLNKASDEDFKGASFIFFYFWLKGISSQWCFQTSSPLDVVEIKVLDDF